MEILYALIPLAIIAMWIYIFNDWYKHAVFRREFWLIIILFTGIIGYLFFYYSNDRR